MCVRLIGSLPQSERAYSSNNKLPPLGSLRWLSLKELSLCMGSLTGSLHGLLRADVYHLIVATDLPAMPRATSLSTSDVIREVENVEIINHTLREVRDTPARVPRRCCTSVLGSIMSVLQSPDAWARERGRSSVRNGPAGLGRVGSESRSEISWGRPLLAFVLSVTPR